MSAVSFEKVIVIGYGKITNHVIRLVYDKKDDYGYEISYIEHEIYPFNQAKKFCGEKNIGVEVIVDKVKLAAYLKHISEKVLIISASNNFLFPKEIVEMLNVTIINFHNALLPAYPGRNAPSWAIYHNEKETGITWHYIDAGIDSGNIIIQKGCEIKPGVKAFELASQLMDLAFEGLEECFDDILQAKVSERKQQVSGKRRMYRSSEIPGGGKFSLDENPEDIYRLLRAVDYGKNDIFPAATTEYDGKTIKIIRYSVVPACDAVPKEKTIYLSLNENEMLRLKYSEI